MSTSDVSDSARANVADAPRYSIQDLAYETQREVRSLIFDLKQRNYELVDMTFQRLQEQIDRRHLFVMFEPKLNCDPLSDHKIPKSVLPIFAGFLDGCHDQLKLDLEQLIGDQVVQAFGRTYQKEIDIKYKLQSRIEQLEIELRGAQDSTMALNNIIAALKSALEAEKKRFLRELATIREQGFQKYRTGQKYVADFADVAALTDAAQLPNVDNINYDTIRSASAKEVRADMSKQQAQIRLLQQQCQQFKKQVDEGVKIKKDYKLLQQKYEETVYQHGLFKRDTDATIAALQAENEVLKAEIARQQTMLTDREQDKQNLLKELAKQQEDLVEANSIRDNYIKLSEAYVKTQDSIKADKERANKAESLNRQLTQQLADMKDQLNVKTQQWELQIKNYDQQNSVMEQLREELANLREQQSRQVLPAISDVEIVEQKSRPEKKKTKNEEIQVPDVSLVPIFPSDANKQGFSRPNNPISNVSSVQQNQVQNDSSIAKLGPGFSYNPDDVEQVMNALYQGSEQLRAKNKMRGLVQGNQGQNSHVQSLYVKQFGKLPESLLQKQQQGGVVDQVVENLQQVVISNTITQQQSLLFQGAVGSDQQPSQSMIQQQNNSSEGSKLGQEMSSLMNALGGDSAENVIADQTIIQNGVQYRQIPFIQVLDNSTQTGEDFCSDNQLQNSVKSNSNNVIGSGQVSQPSNNFGNQQQVIQNQQVVLSQQVQEDQRLESNMQNQQQIQQANQQVQQNVVTYPPSQHGNQQKPNVINGQQQKLNGQQQTNQQQGNLYNQAQPLNSQEINRNNQHNQHNQSQLVDQQLQNTQVPTSSNQIVGYAPDSLKQTIFDNQQKNQQSVNQINYDQMALNDNREIVVVQNIPQQIQIQSNTKNSQQQNQTQANNYNNKQQQLQTSSDDIKTAEQLKQEVTYQQLINENAKQEQERLLKQQEMLRLQQEIKKQQEEKMRQEIDNLLEDKELDKQIAANQEKLSNIQQSKKNPCSNYTQGQVSQVVGVSLDSQEQDQLQHDILKNPVVPISEPKQQISQQQLQQQVDIMQQQINGNRSVSQSSKGARQQYNIIEQDNSLVLQSGDETRKTSSPNSLFDQSGVDINQKQVVVQFNPQVIIDQHVDNEVDQQLGNQVRIVTSHLSYNGDHEDSDGQNDEFDQMVNKELQQKAVIQKQTGQDENMQFAVVQQTQETQTGGVPIDTNSQIVQIRENNLISLVQTMTHQPISNEQKAQLLQLMQKDLIEEAEKQQKQVTNGSVPNDPAADPTIVTQQDGSTILVQPSQKTKIANAILKDQLVNNILKQQAPKFDHQHPQEAVKIVNDKNLQQTILTGQPISDDQSKKLQEVFYNPDVLRKVVEIMPSLNPTEQKLLSVIYKPDFSDRLINNKLSQNELKVIGKVIYNQHVAGLISDQTVKVDFDKQTETLYKLLQQQELVQEKEAEINVITFANNINKAMMTKKQVSLHSDLLDKLKRISSDEFYNKLIEGDSSKDVQDEIFNVLSDHKLMNRLLENEFERETSKKLYKIYNTDMMNALQNNAASNQQCKLVVDTLFDPKVTAAIFGAGDHTDSEVMKLLLKRQQQIQAQLNIQQIQNVIFDPQAAKKLAEGQMSKQLQKALLKVFYSQETADAIANGRFSQETASQLSAVLYNPAVARQLQQSYVDPTVLKQVAQTVYNQEVMGVIQGFVNTADTKNKANLCVQVVKEVAQSGISYQPQQLQPFRVRLDPTTSHVQLSHIPRARYMRPRRSNFSSGIHVQNRQYVGVIPRGSGDTSMMTSQTYQFDDLASSVGISTRGAPSFIKTYTIEPRVNTAPRSSRQSHFPSSEELVERQRQRVNQYRYQTKLTNEYSIPRGVPCCIVTLAEDENFVSDVEIENRSVKAKSPPKLPVQKSNSTGRETKSQIATQSALLMQFPTAQQIIENTRKPPSTGLQLKDLEIDQQKKKDEK